MKVFYCGCKAQMKAERMVFHRGKGVEVTEEVNIKVMKIDGFHQSMTDEAKKELKFNIQRENDEIEKVNGNVRIVEVTDPKIKNEIEELKAKLAEATDGSQLVSLTAENTKLTTELKECQAKLQAAQLSAKK